MTPKAKTTALVLSGAVALSFTAYAIGSQTGGGNAGAESASAKSSRVVDRHAPDLPPRRLRRGRGGRAAPASARALDELAAKLGVSTAALQQALEDARARACRARRAPRRAHRRSSPAALGVDRGQAARRDRHRASPSAASATTSSPPRWRRSSASAPPRSAPRSSKLHAQGRPGRRRPRRTAGRPREGDRRLARPSSSGVPRRCARTSAATATSAATTATADLAKALGISQAKVEAGVRAARARTTRPSTSSAATRSPRRWPRASSSTRPKVKAALEDLRPRARGPSATPEPLVLVVDDEASVRQALERALRLEGFAVSTAAGGREALEAVAQRPPAVIVLDVTMPDLDGVTVVRRLRADGHRRAGLHPVRPRRGRRPRRRPAGRRRRLPRQAVRDRGADRAPAGAAAPPRRRRAPARWSSATSSSTRAATSPRAAAATSS